MTKRLVLLKDCIKEVSRQLEKQDRGHHPATGLEDRLGITMKFLRAAEQGHLGEISKCLELYPDIRLYVDNPYQIEGNMTTMLRGIRDHAINLAREHALDELGKPGGDEQTTRQIRQKARDFFLSWHQAGTTQ